MRSRLFIGCKVWRFRVWRFRVQRFKVQGYIRFRVQGYIRFRVIKVQGSAFKGSGFKNCEYRKMNRRISKGGFAPDLPVPFGRVGLLNLYFKMTVQHKSSRRAEYIVRCSTFNVRCLQSASGGFDIH
jgi:hypothetical protein